MAELDRKFAELGQDFGPVRLYLLGFCLILAQFAYFSIVFTKNFRNFELDGENQLS